MEKADTIVGRRTAIGGTWTVGARLVSRIVDLGTMVALAHLLQPKDFGLVAIAMTVIYIVEAALELPLSQALVRLKHVESEHYDTAFTLGLIRGFALSTIVCLVSWPFAHFYSDSRLLLLVCVLSLAPASRGLVSPRLADFSRNFDFTPDFIMELIGKLVAFTSAIAIALTTRSYWSIAVGTVLAPAVSTTVSYFLAPYRPKLGLLRLSAFSGFLGWITAAQVVSSINWQADRLILGKLSSRAELGLFTAANDTANIPLLAFMSPIMRPLLSAFSVLREVPERLQNSYQSSCRAIVTFGLPILIGESIMAEAFVRLFFGEKWIGSAVLLRWLAISLIPTLFAAPLGPLVMSFGKTEIFLKHNLLELTIKLPLVIIGALKFGFMGIIMARGISEVSSLVYSMIVVRRLIKLSIFQQVIAPWRSVLSVSAMGLVLALISPQLARLSGPMHLGAGTAATVLAGAFTYVAVTFSLWIAVGSPSGIEAMVTEKVLGFLKKNKSDFAVDVA
jgi:O-antigen/teichoic acid export membrane protein